MHIREIINEITTEDASAPESDAPGLTPEQFEALVEAVVERVLERLSRAWEA